MKRLVVLSLLASGGCGAAVDLPTDGSTFERMRNKLVPWDIAGAYVGQDTCTTTATHQGGVLGTGTEQFQLATTFSSDGIPLAQSITRLDGVDPSHADGQFTTTCTKTEVSFGDDSIVIRELCTQLVEGVDSCAFALDGNCDEPLNCPWATDFTDCGPIRWDLEKRTKYVFPFDGTIFRTVSQSLLESEIGDDFLTTECTGELHRESTP